MKNKKKINKKFIIGAGCAIASIVLCFVISPIVSKATVSTVNVLVASEMIHRGDCISPSSVKVISVNKNALPSGYFSDPKDVQLKYAKTDIYPQDILTRDKIQSEQKDKNTLFYELGEWTAFSMKLSNLSDYVSGHIETGDVVSVVIDTNQGKTIIPPSLKYVKVITVTSSEGVDKDQSSDGFLPASVTLQLTEEQAVELAGYALNREVTLVLRAKTGTAYADILLSEQYEYLFGGEKQ